MKFSIKPLFHSGAAYLKTHSPEILTGIGVGGFISAIVLAVRATPGALEDIQEAKNNKGEELTAFEIVSACWKNYIPTAIASASATICCTSALTIESRRTAALATIAQLTEDNLSELRNSMVESLGDRRAETVKEEAAAAKVKDQSVVDCGYVQTKYGEDIFYDPWCHKFFACNKDRIRLAEEEINNSLEYEDFIPLNEFYYKIGLESTHFGTYAGFSSNRGEQCHVTYGYGPTQDGRSCSVMDYDIFINSNIRKLVGTDCVM